LLAETCKYVTYEPYDVNADQSALSLNVYLCKLIWIYALKNVEITTEMLP
jgi:hypothetical protein